MLQKLYIRNYAIIDELSLEFDREMNVITGETGAGKSIILGALALILGERADTSVLINREEKSIVEALFLTEHNRTVQQLLLEADLDVEQHTIIRREISPGGKSRAFINDTPVTLTVLNKLSAALVDLHRQFDLRAMEQEDFLYEVVDAVADTRKMRNQYQQSFHQYRQTQHAYQKLEAEQLQWQKEADYKQFLFEELEQANLSPGEIELATIHLKQLEHAEQILNTLHTVHDVLEGSEQPVNHELKRALQQLQTIASVFPEADALTQRLESSLLELRDIAEEALLLQEKTEMNPEQLQRTQERLDMAYRLLKKHGVNTTEELLLLQQQLQAELMQQSNAGKALQELQEQITALEKELVELAADLSKQRGAALPYFETQINNLLQPIGMPNAVLKITLSLSADLHKMGRDHIQFLLDANKSGQFLPVQKAASGGELSRIMLCIKALTAKALELPTLIFDEIDTGISGEAAHQVSILLQDLGHYHQVVCITHLPQVAGRGNKHFFVYKAESDSGKIITRIRVLGTEERVSAIAEMIGGAQPSQAAIENARELVK